MGSIDITQFLLDQGADPSIEAEGYTARSLAEKSNQTEIFELLK